MDRTAFEADLRRLGFQEIVEGSVPPHTDREAHAHDFEVRALMLEGALDVGCDGSTRRYLPGEVFTMPAGADHTERTEVSGARYLVGRRRGQASR